ncbi:MAG: transglutaminase domain-containing protein [Methanoregula sp.]
MKRLFLILLVIATLLIAGCTTSQNPDSPVSAGNALNARADQEYAAANYGTAAELYRLARENFTAEGNTTGALAARDGISRSHRMIMEFPYNRSMMNQVLAKSFPDIPAETREAWLNGNDTITITSDGETLYFEDTAANFLFHNMTLVRKFFAAGHGSPFNDQLTPFVFAPVNESQVPYGKPVAWQGTETISVPRNELPANGTLKIWFPLPIESGSQTNVTIVSIEPAQYLKSTTGTTGDIGIAYLEVPLGEQNDPFLNITATYRFVQHEQRFVIDPVKVLPYNTSGPEYRKFTASSANIAVSPEIRAKAKEIVGNETNPHLQAQKIYWYIVDTLPYSHVPHMMLTNSGIPESEFVFTTGFGDCGTQSTYFAALCRSLGIPARTTGGFQLVPGSAGTHFWAEYYLEGYGWIPVDVTAAEAGDWAYNATDEERHQFKAYYFGGLDPYRYIIQNDADQPLTPDPGNAVLIRSVFQGPAVVCDTCPDDPELLIASHFTADTVQV